MPSILNLKFKGNKSFVPFSNLNDADSLTKTWKVCTKVASFLEQGQRLENLSWRLWHLQNLMVDTDNAKSKRDFKKLSKCMSDKLDKEKGRSIEELQAPGFRRNHSTELLQQRALEKEREREANQNGRPGTIHRMQFTFSVDQPAPPTAFSVTVKKPDLRPSPEFKDNAIKRGRPATRSTVVEDAPPAAVAVVDRDPPLTQRGRKPSASTTNESVSSNDLYSSASLRFPSLFSNDFGPEALLYPTPSLTTPMTYGEGVSLNTHTTSDGFSIARPTIELPLDEFLNADSPDAWSSGGYSSSDARLVEQLDAQEDVEMKSLPGNPAFLSGSPHVNEDDDMLGTSSHFRATPTLAGNVQDIVPRTITPSRIGPNSGPGVSQVSGKRPSLSVRTQSVSTRSSGPSATPVNGIGTAQQNLSNNSAPGGVKAECSNCGATHTPLWRRGLNDELNCNACGLYCKLHKRPRPKSMRNNHGEGRTQAAPRQESQEVVAQCYNCHTTATPLWRKDDEGKTVCNACGLYYKLHGSARPISMKSDVIRKRARHDARRVPGSSETPSASPGASRRASPIAEATPTLAPDSTTQSSSPFGSDGMDFHQSLHSLQSELQGALGVDNQSMHFGNQLYSFQYQSFPGPYHPDYINQTFPVTPSDALPYASNDMSDMDMMEGRSHKRRRMSTDSASEPPSSAVSFGSFSDSFSSSSATSQSQRSSVDVPYYSFQGMLRGASNSSWHPPMLPPNNPSPYVHPPMLPPDDPTMFFHPQVMQDDADALFATYLHPPMVHPDSPPMSSLSLHPPMLPNDWKVAAHADMYDSAMVSF